MNIFTRQEMDGQKTHAEALCVGTAQKVVKMEEAACGCKGSRCQNPQLSLCQQPGASLHEQFPKLLESGS